MTRLQKIQGIIICITVLFLIIYHAICYGALDVTITWDANTDSTIGYKACYGHYSGNTKKFVFTNCSTVVGRANNIKTITNLNDLQDWFFRVKAYNSWRESDYSNVVILDVVKTPTANKFQKIQMR